MYFPFFSPFWSGSANLLSLVDNIISKRLLEFLQVPLYPATIFQNETDGEGLSFVLYFRISDSYSKELPLYFQENIKVS